MTNLTPELLQSISVKCAAKFMSKQASLSKAVADEALTNELGPEQIKRVIETTNTIAYLRQLQDSPDRTFEFPVAEYRQVLSHMSIPETGTETLPDMDKTAYSPETYSDFSKPVHDLAFLSTPEKLSILTHETLRCTQVLEKMACESQILANKLVKAISKVRASDNILEKVAFVVEENDYDNILSMCKLEKDAAKSNNLVFTDLELSDVFDMYSLYKEACEFQRVKLEKQQFVIKASSIIENLGSGIGKGIGAIGSAGVSLAKKVVSPIPTAVKSRKIPTAVKSRKIPAGAKFLGKMGLGAMGVEHTNDVWSSLN